MFKFSIRAVFGFTLLVAVLLSVFLLARQHSPERKRTGFLNGGYLNGVKIPVGSEVFEMTLPENDGSNVIMRPGDLVDIFQINNGQVKIILTSVTVCYSEYENGEMEFGIVLTKPQMQKVALLKNKLRVVLRGR